MAYSTVQRVALASGLVLAMSLLLPKVFLSRGKRQEPPPAPEGKLRPAPLEPPASLLRVGRTLLQGGVTPVPTYIRKTGWGRHTVREVPSLTVPLASVVSGRPPATATFLSLLTFKGQERVLPCWAPSKWPAHTRYSQPLPLPGFSQRIQVLSFRRAPTWNPSLGFLSAFCCVFICNKVRWNWWW